MDSTDNWRKVRMTTYLMQMLVEAAQGAGISIDWGEPDGEGFYVPTVGIRRWRVLSAHYPTLRTS